VDAEAMKVAVVGHVEWVDSIRVDHVPAPGEIAHGARSWSEPAGGGAVAAVQLARLAGGCAFYTALGRDEVGRRSLERLGSLGLTVFVAWRDEPTRQAVTFVERSGERTITTIGERLWPERADDLPWDDLANVDAVFVCATDDGGLRAARRARVLTATPREGPTLRTAGVRLDALVGSGRDPGERYEPGSIQPPPAFVVRTLGRKGGTWDAAGGDSGRFDAVPPPVAPPGVEPDAYGCGDSFAGGLTFALGSGLAVEAAVALAARCGAVCASGPGPYARQLTAT
jgi:ribokinase